MRPRNSRFMGSLTRGNLDAPLLWGHSTALLPVNDEPCMQGKAAGY